MALINKKSIIKYEDFELSFEKFKTLREDKDKVPDYLKGMYVWFTKWIYLFATKNKNTK